MFLFTVKVCHERKILSRGQFREITILVACKWLCLRANFGNFPTMCCYWCCSTCCCCLKTPFKVLKHSPDVDSTKCFVVHFLDLNRVTDGELSPHRVTVYISDSNRSTISNNPVAFLQHKLVFFC